MGRRAAILSYRKNGLVVKIKQKSVLLDLSTVSNGDLFAGLAIPRPKELHGFHNIPSFILPKTTCLPSNNLVLAVQIKKLGTLLC